MFGAQRCLRWKISALTMFMFFNIIFCKESPARNQGQRIADQVIDSQVMKFYTKLRISRVKQNVCLCSQCQTMFTVEDFTRLLQAIWWRESLWSWKNRLLWHSLPRERFKHSFLFHFSRWKPLLMKITKNRGFTFLNGSEVQSRGNLATCNFWPRRSHKHPVSVEGPSYVKQSGQMSRDFFHESFGDSAKLHFLSKKPKSVDNKAVLCSQFLWPRAGLMWFLSTPTMTFRGVYCAFSVNSFGAVTDKSNGDYQSFWRYWLCCQKTYMRTVQWGILSFNLRNITVQSMSRLTSIFWDGKWNILNFSFVMCKHVNGMWKHFLWKFFPKKGRINWKKKKTRFKNTWENNFLFLKY